jgi:hypothetical protein
VFVTEGAIWGLVLALFIGLLWFGRKHPGRRVGSAAVGSVYDMLNEDKRKAVEIVVEDRAGARDPEDADGNLPDLEDPTGARGRTP